MSLQMDGTQSPADAIRVEIDRLKKEAGFEEVENQEESVEESETPSFTETIDDEPVIQPPREETVDYWKHRFDVVQGKYNAETARMNEQINYMRSELEELKNRPEPTYESSQTVHEILDDLEDQYGSEFTTAIDKRIDRIVAQKVKEAVNGFERDLSTVKQTQAVSEQQMFEDVIDKLAPNWRSLNVNDEFVYWVQNNTENFSGVTFQQILVNAYNQRDAGKVAKIFNTYEQLKQKSNTRQTGTKQEAAQHVAPPKRGSQANATIENNSGQVITQAQIQEFYNNLAQGAYKGKDTWVRSMKEEILKANAEGRIV